jgi:hypothetical protein
VLALVLPISLCPLPGPLYSVLMGYKEAPLAEVRRGHGATVDRVFSQFLWAHRRCVSRLLVGPVGLVLPVPSSSRPGPPPLDRIEGLGRHAVAAVTVRTRKDPPLWCPSVLERTGQPVGHMAAHPAAFAVPPWAAPVVSHTRVLLLDDTYVSGARAQSAAAALRLAGARRVLIVPMGRVIRPDMLTEHARLLRRSRTSRAGPHRCARCVMTQRDVEADSGAATGPGTE